MDLRLSSLAMFYTADIAPNDPDMCVSVCVKLAIRASWAGGPVPVVAGKCSFSLFDW